MNLLHAISGRLERELQSLSVDGIRPPLRLAAAVENVRKRFGAGHSNLVTRDRVSESVRRLLRDGASALTRRDRFVLAHSLAQPVSELGNGAVLGNEQIARPLIDRWDAEARRGELRPSHWRGLFHSYMQSEHSSAANAVRDFLRGSVAALARGFHRKPPWFETVERHNTLLTAVPCAPYVDELLEGRREKLSDLVRELRPPEASWFWEELIGALVRQLDRINDAEFRARIDSALNLTRDVKSHRDQILAAVLDRYGRTRDRARHAHLLAFALDAWKSPQLTRNALWNLVQPDTKQMVCGWLAQEDLEDFYRLCQGERRVDERRLRYWLRFKKQIVFSQIILGQGLLWSRDPDAREFRDRKKGRLAQLIGSGASNNAMLMQIGDYVFVEFSETKNACYVYRADDKLFQIGESAYSISGLKRKDAPARLIHNGEWERDRFDPELAALEISPDSQRADRPAVTRMASPRSDRRMRESEGNGHAASVLSSALEGAIRKAGGKITDHRAKGGCLWVVLDRHDGTLDRQLYGAGFKLKIGKGYYLE